MCNSIKIYGKDLVSQTIHISYKNLTIPYKIIKKYKIDENELLNIDLFPIYNTILNDYFTKIDIYVYKTDKLIFSFNNLKIEGKSVIIEEIYDELIRFIKEYFIRELELLSNYDINVYLKFCYKHNLKRMGCKILEYNSHPIYNFLFGRTAQIDYLKIHNPKDLLIFFDKIVDNPLILEPIIDPKNLTYLERVYYFTKMALRYEKIGQIKQSCTYFVHLYFCLKDEKHLYLKNYIHKKVMANVIWARIFERIFNKIQKNEKEEVQIFLKNIELPILEKKLIVEDEKFDFKISFRSLEKIDYFKKSNVYSKSEGRVYFNNHITCTLISKVPFTLLSFVIDKEILINREISTGIQKFNFNLQDSCHITHLKIIEKNIVKLLPIEIILFQKIKLNYKYREVGIFEEKEHIKLVFSVEYQTKPNVYVLNEKFDLKYESNRIEVYVKISRDFEIMAQVCENGFRKYLFVKRNNEWKLSF